MPMHRRDDRGGGVIESTQVLPYFGSQVNKQSH